MVVWSVTMKVLLVFGFSSLFVLLAQGADTNNSCFGVEEDALCNDVLTYNCGANGFCSCKKGTPYCRCVNKGTKWYIGDKCDQEWDTTLLAVVATLPGLALAVLVGAIVFLVSKLFYTKKNKKGKTNPAFHQEQEDDMFKNTVFASELKEHPRPPPGSMEPPNAMPNHDQSQQRGLRPVEDRPFMGGPPPQSNRVPPPPTDSGYPNRPGQSHSQQSGFHPAQDRPFMGGPPPQSNRMPPPTDSGYPNRPGDQSHSQQSGFHPAQDRPFMGGPPPQSNRMPPPTDSGYPNSQQSGIHPAQDRPFMGGPPPQYNSSRMGPASSNPYAKPSPGGQLYGNHGPPQGYDSDNGYRANQPPVNGMPPFSQPDYNTPQRPMMGGRY